MKKLKVVLSLLLTACILLPFGGMFSQQALAAGKWVAAWSTSTVNGSIKISGLSLQDIIPSRSTIRTELTVATGGSKLRFCFSNEYGAASIVINDASVAKTDTNTKAAVLENTLTPITFDDKDYVEIPAGKTVWSDEISFQTEALEKISVSLYFENFTYITSTGLSNGQTYLSTGSALLGSTSRVNNRAFSASSEISIGSGAITYHTVPFLSKIDTCSDKPNACAAVFIGDSTLVNDTYLDYAIRAVNAGADNVGIVNEAIIGNKLLSDGTGMIGKLYGDALIKRFERDVLTAAGVKYCFVKIGLNDILHQFTKSMAKSTPKYSPADIINGYKTLVSLAHSKGIKIYFFTKSAWNGYERSFLGQTGDLTWNAEAQAMCDELDKWIKGNNEADGYIDCSPLADPSDKTKLCPSFTPDGAHLTYLGAIALADLIPLEYIGVKAPNAKTVAEIMNADPYAEKRSIEKALEEKKNEPATVAPENNEPTTNGQAPATDIPVTQPLPSQEYTTGVTTTVPFIIPSTEAASTSALFTYAYEEPSSSTIYNYQGSDIDYTKKNVNYVVNDVDLDVDEIGSEMPIGFILVLFSSIVAAAVIVILTIGKKKEEF